MANARLTDPAATLSDFDPVWLEAAAGGDPDLAEELIVLFERQCEALLPILATPGPIPPRAEAAHRLRGAAGAIGAPQVAAAAAALEQAGSEESARLAAAEFLAAIVAFREALDRHRASRSAE